MSLRRIIVLSSLAILVAGFLAVIIFVPPWRNPRLPYSDKFQSNRAEEWTAYGGSWQLKDGTLVNRSDERGAKVVTGSSNWDDYSVSAEMMMMGHGGDIGLIARVDQPEKGINAYRGYYVGIRAQDQALVMGAADHDWIETRPVPVRGGVQHLVWYRLQVLFVQCDVAAHLENLQTHVHTWARMRATPCFKYGKVGLRSLNSGAAFRNFSVLQASVDDWEKISAQLPALSDERFPVREADYALMRQSYYKPELILDSLLGPAGGSTPERLTAEPALESIHSLEMTHRAETVRVRGVVTLTDPLYIQDGSGGIRVQIPPPHVLNVGDEVELVGRMQEARKASFEIDSYRVLWESSLVTPASISSTQAATGSFDGSLVELSGVLRSWRESEDGTLELGLEDIAERFTVKMPRGLSEAIPTWWQIGSIVRVRGVCISGTPAYSQSAFLLLLRNPSDVEYLSSPPWTQGIRLVVLIAIGALMLASWALAYLRADRRRMRAVLAERELLAAEMHDTLAQSFAGVGYHLQSIRKGLQICGNVPENLMRKVDLACSMAVTAHCEASEKIRSLWNKRQQDHDLLDELFQSAISMLNGVDIKIDLNRIGSQFKLSSEIHDAFWRIGEEAIANILRHSQATEMRLSLTFSPQIAELCIEDNGVGFDQAITLGSVGRKSMEFRARQVNAKVEIISAPGQGCKVVVRAPLRFPTRWKAQLSETLGRAKQARH
jgi:signal transduction histidine kinase